MYLPHLDLNLCLASAYANFDVSTLDRILSYELSLPPGRMVSSRPSYVGNTVVILVEISRRCFSLLSIAKSTE